MLTFKNTSDPSLFETQPRAIPDHELELTLVSLNPSAVLARSHVAKSVIHPPPASSVHLPDPRIGGNPTKSVPSALHCLAAA